jgi:hypothetical protein
MGAGCAHFVSGYLSYVKFCGRSPDFLPEVSGNGSESQMCFEPPELTSKANDPQRLTRCGSFGKTFGDEKLLSFAKDAIYLGATDWANALCHATTRVRNLYSSFKITLLFALNAVSVTFVCLCHVKPPIDASICRWNSTKLTCVQALRYPRSRSNWAF